MTTDEARDEVLGEVTEIKQALARADEHLTNAEDCETLADLRENLNQAHHELETAIKQLQAGRTTLWALLKD